jgi:uncharacterized membrane protein
MQELIIGLVLLLGSHSVVALAPGWRVVVRERLARRGGLKVKGAPPAQSNDAFALVAGVLLYALIAFGTHASLFGVAPFGSWPFAGGR